MVTIEARCLGHLACACRSWLGNMRALQVVVHSHLHLSHFHFVFKSLSIWFSTLLFNVAMAECCLKPRPQSLMVGFIQALDSEIKLSASELKSLKDQISTHAATILQCQRPALWLPANHCPHLCPEISFFQSSADPSYPSEFHSDVFHSGSPSITTKSKMKNPLSYHPAFSFTAIIVICN